MPARNVIKLRTGTGTPTAASFATSEPAWDSTNGYLYVKSAGGQMIPVGPIPYATTANFPATGVKPTVYLATDTGRLYQWTGTAYAEMGATGGPSFARTIQNIGFSGTAQAINTLVDSYFGMLICTLNNNCTFTFASPAAAQSFRLMLIQDATGGWTPTFNNTVVWTGNVIPKMPKNANTFTVYCFVNTGTQWYGWVDAAPSDATSGIFAL